MSWAGSTRRHRLPDDWESLRLSVLRDADWVCEIRYEDRCTGHATDVDHINRGDDHSRENLQAACRKCHLKKSSIEGNQARWAKHARKKRPPERHPGYR